MRSGSTRDHAIWSIVAVAVVSFTSGILLMLGVHRLFAHDPVYMLLMIFMLFPLLIAAILANTRRVLKDIS